MRRAGITGMAGGWLAAATLWLAGCGSPGGPPTVKQVVVPTPPPPVTTTDTLRAGQTLAELLGGQGFTPRQAARLIAQVRGYQSPRRLRPGAVLAVTARPEQSPESVLIELDRDRRLQLDATDSGWVAHLDSVPLHPDTIRIGGRITASLFTADLSGDTDRLVSGEQEELLARLSEIFAWQIDFYRDIREGDAFRVVIRRELRPDGSVSSARILGAEFANRGRLVSGIGFRYPDGRWEYFRRDGQALRSAFTRAPLKFPRITSGFSRHRYHPILHRYRAHLGIDYGADRGTPVYATGAGVITRAGRWGGYGRMVEIRHNSTYRTRYAHLSAIARGIHPGVHVDQGQMIGRVGMSGLATGPHLHYEFLVNGRQRDPAKVDLPPGKPIEKQYVRDFDASRDSVVRLLDRTPFPPLPEARVASSGSGRSAG